MLFRPFSYSPTFTNTSTWMAIWSTCQAQCTAPMSRRSHEVFVIYSNRWPLTIQTVVIVWLTPTKLSTRPNGFSNSTVRRISSLPLLPSIRPTIRATHTESTNVSSFSNPKYPSLATICHPTRPLQNGSSRKRFAIAFAFNSNSLVESIWFGTRLIIPWVMTWSNL